MTPGGPPAAPRSLGPATVLVVDDTPAGRYVTSRALRAAGFKVVEAATGGEALTLATTGVDLVVLDVNLPDVNGFEVCRRLKNEPRTASMPVLHLSATYVRPRDRVSGLEGGADAYLTSPADPAELVASVNALLRMHWAESDLKRAALDWQSTFDALQDGVCLIDPDGNITRRNQAFEHFADGESGAVLGALCTGSVEARAPGPDSPCLLDQARASRARVSTGVRLEHRRLTVTVDPVFSDDGAFRGAVAVVSDHTERELAEEMVRESEVRFRATFNNAPVGIAHVAADGTFRLVNDTFSTITGYSREEMLALTFQDITHPDDLEEDLANVRRLVAGEIDSYSLDKRYKRKDGEPIWVTLTASLVRTPQGDPHYFIAVIEDTSVRRRLEEQLRHSQKMEAVGRLAGGVAHDFNNVLTAIAGYVDLLLERIEAGDPRRADVEEIGRATTRAATLTRQLLAFSRSQALAPVVLDINETVTGMERMLQRLIGEDIQLVTKTTPEIGSVRADPGQLEQVVMNLAVNSRDAMPEGGRLEIETGLVALSPEEAEAAALDPGQYVTLTVSDAGHGMDEHTLSHLFEPFFTTKESGRGTGLGLATVYGIVAQSRGGITVRSELGRGTSVRVLLPQIDERATKVDIPVVTARSGGGETLLLVEDDDALRTLARRILVRAGYEVLEAVDGRAALELARTHAGRIDALVTDMVMPRMSGRQLAREFLAQRSSAAIVLMSGYTEESVTGEDLTQEVTFLPKPFLPAALLQAVRAALEQAASRAG